MAESTEKDLLSWEVGEYNLHNKGIGWYIGAFIITAALLISAVVSKNFLFAFIVIMFVVISATHTLRAVPRYTFKIMELGAQLGERFHAWKDIENFWIVYEPPEIKMLYFEFPGLRPRLPIPLEDVDPNKVRKILSGHIKEDTSKTEEPISDWLARVLKI